MMKLCHLGILVVFLGACGSGDPADDSGGDSDAGSDADAGGGDSGEPASFAGTVAAHNQARAAVGVGPVVWDEDLAAIAQAWAERCVDQDSVQGLIDHNDGRSDDYPGYVGENIYGSSVPSTGPDAVETWVSEASNYDYDTNSCSGICGHYTQVVWADTTHIGCGMYNCAGLQYSYSIVCDYAPGGNDGGRPY